MNAIGPSLRTEGEATPVPGGRGALFCRLLQGVRHALCLIGWNAAWLITGLVLIAAAGEIWFRMTAPFARNVHPTLFVPGVGHIRIRKPLAEMRRTNNVDFWTVSRANSLGFLDREPIDPERAAASCHIAMIGDSFVEGMEVSIPDKFHVRLEELAARERPELNVTTSAFGISGTAQINQLPYYDEFARHLHPKLVVLVFVRNDFLRNASLRNASLRNAARESHGGEPHAKHARPRRPLLPRLRKVLEMSWFAQWLHDKSGWTAARRIRKAEQEVSLEATAFALDRFKKYTSRDGASLAILTSHTIGRRGERMFDRLRAIADERGIPVIDQYDYIIRKGGRIEDAHWTHDEHWNVTGHRWAAEALFEYLEQHPETCDGTVAEGTTHGGTS